MRNSITIPSLVALFFSPCSLAVGLGHIQLHSALGQPLSAEIPINLGQNKLHANQMDVTLTAVGDKRTATDHANTGDPVSQYKAKLVQLSNGGVAIKLSSVKGLDTPYVRFQVNLKTPSGQLSREYTLLLDPPEFAATNTVADVVAYEHKNADSHYAVMPETAKPVAAAMTRSEQKKANKLAARQHRFKSNADVVKVAANNSEPKETAKTTTDKQVVSHTKVKVTSQGLHAQAKAIGSANSKHPATQPRLPASEFNTATSTYGPTRQHETLWSIIKKLPKYDNISPAQMEYAIVQKNPSAFIQGNVNGLKLGMVLKIPSHDEVITYAEREVEQEIEEQGNLWEAFHAQLQEVAIDGMETIALMNNVADKPVTLTALLSNDRKASQTTTDANYASMADGKAKSSYKTETIQVTSASKNASADTLKPKSQSTKTSVPSAALSSETLLALQSELAITVKRMNLIQASQRDILGKTSTLEANQQNLESFLERKNNELAQVDNRLTDLNKQLQQLQMKIPNLPDAAVATSINEAATSWSSTMPSVLGFGLLSGGLLGGLWYARRREWFNLGDADDIDTLEYEEFATDTPTTIIDSHDGEFIDVESEAAANAPNHLSPLDEADTLMHYQQYDQAESVLKEAIAKEPTKADYHEKLLAVYAEQGDLSAFERTVQHMQQNSLLSDEQLMSNIRDLKLASWPSQQIEALATTAEARLIEAVESTDNNDMNKFNNPTTVGIQTNAVDDNTIIGSANTFEAPMAEITQASLAGAVESTTQPQTSAVDTAVEAKEKLGLSFKTTDNAVVEKAEPALFAENSDPIFSHEAQKMSIQADEDILRESKVSEAIDDPETALDLAKAYIELDDIESAITLLEKVKEDSNPVAADEAASLLNTLKAS